MSTVGNPPQQSWTEAVKCADCQSPFGVFLWKHPCTGRRAIPRFGLTTPSRVCDLCFVALCIESQDEATLMKLPVSQLRTYATRRSIDLNSCIEKKDIIDTFLQHYRSRAQSQRTNPPPQNQTNSPPPPAAAPQQTYRPYATVNVSTNSGYPGQQPRPPPPSTYPGQMRNNPPYGTQYPPYVSSNVHTYAPQYPLQQRPVPQQYPNPQQFPSQYSQSPYFPPAPAPAPAPAPSSAPPLVEKDEESEEESAPDGTPDDELCVVCLDRKIKCVFIDCGHLACCKTCSRKLKDCPMCRKPIIRYIPVFHANKE